jgi:hypothetical protein
MMSTFNYLSQVILNKLVNDGINMVEDLPNYDDEMAWKRLEKKRRLDGAEYNAIRKAIKPGNYIPFFDVSHCPLDI